MRVIYDNIIFSLQRAGGISLVWYELSRRLLINKNIDFGVIENERAKNNIFRKLLNIRSENISAIETGHVLKRYMPPPVLNITVPFIFHSSYYRISSQKNAINITTVHDFTYEHFVRGLPKYINYLQKAIAIKKSKGIICISNSTKNDLLHFFPKTDIRKIRVIYNGVSNNFRYLDDKSHLQNEKFCKLKGCKYILFVGNRKRYKNFRCAVETLVLLDGYSIVIAGGGKMTSRETKNLSKRIPGRFFIFPELTDEDLNNLYNNAFCLLYPSLYEGFGLPVIEAMKAGCPVIATSSSSIPEIAGDAAILVDEIIPSEFAKRILSLEQKEFRINTIRKGFERSKMFSWDKCASEVINFYDEVSNLLI